MLSSLKLVLYSGLQCFMCHVRYSRSLIKLDMQFNLTLTGRKHNIIRQHCNCGVVTSELFRTVVVFRDNTDSKSLRERLSMTESITLYNRLRPQKLDDNGGKEWESEQLQWSVALKMAGISVDTLYLSTIHDVSSEDRNICHMNYLSTMVLFDVCTVGCLWAGDNMNCYCCTQ